jgi:ABC-type transporter Mla subunit MlaD
MSSTKKDNLKETTTNQIKESTDRYLEQQRQQYKDTASNISQTTDKINQTVNKFQEDNRRIFENNTDIFRKYQEQVRNTIQEVTNNAMELQKKVFDTYQSSYNQFFDNINNNNNDSYWKNFNIPERYSEVYSTVNKNIQNYTINATNIINEIITGGIENFNKATELTQRYYNDIVKNNLNYTQKIERSYNRQ